MLPFPYIGRDWREKNRPRALALEILGFVFAILLFPFTLLTLLFVALWRLGDSRSAAR